MQQLHGSRPAISSSPTKLGTVYTFLCNSIASACSLSQEQVVVVLDQANSKKREYGVMVMISCSHVGLEVLYVPRGWFLRRGQIDTVLEQI